MFSYKNYFVHLFGLKLYFIFIKTRTFITFMAVMWYMQLQLFMPKFCLKIVFIRVNHTHGDSICVFLYLREFNILLSFKFNNFSI